MNITIRDVDAKVFRNFKAEAARDEKTLGRAVTIAMKMWLEKIKKEEKKKKNILDLKPFDWGKGTDKSSLEVDETLYGG